MAPVVPSMAVPQGPFPITETTGAQVRRPSDGGVLRWVRVSNSSPFTVTVSAGLSLGQVGAFNDHLFALPPSSNVLDIQPVAGSGIAVAGTDSSVYVTWYDSTPVGSFPVPLGAAAITATPTQLLGSFAVSVAPQPAVQTINVSGIASYHAALVCIFVDSSVGPSPIVVDIRHAAVGVIQPPSLLWGTTAFPPAAGETVNQLVTPIVGAAGTTAVIEVRARDGAAGTTTGTLFVLALSQFPTALNLPMQPIDYKTSDEVNVGAGGSVQVMPPPEFGTIYKVKACSWLINTAAVSGGRMEFKRARGAPQINAIIIDNSVDNVKQGRAYFPDVWISDAINFSNGSNATAIACVLAEVWPITQTPG